MDVVQLKRWPLVNVMASLFARHSRNIAMKEINYCML